MYRCSMLMGNLDLTRLGVCKTVQQEFVTLL